MKTILYLLRHAATPANLSHPARLQGRNNDPPLAPLGVRQAEVTREHLAIQPFDLCYCSPLRRAVQTAAIICEPHGITPRPLDALIECDVGKWEGLDWETIKSRNPKLYERYMANPAQQGYPGGENFAEVHERASAELDRLLVEQAGKSILVVSHHVVNRTYLAGLLGLPPSQARRVSLDNCGISVVIREKDKSSVQTLNGVLHLQGVL